MFLLCFALLFFFFTYFFIITVYVNNDSVNKVNVQTTYRFHSFTFRLFSFHSIVCVGGWVGVVWVSVEGGGGGARDTILYTFIYFL